MQPSLPRLVRIRPVPASAFTIARLPPVMRPASSPVSAAPEGAVGDQSSSTTLAKALISRSASPGWPKNLRVHSFEEKKEKFWKVPKKQRDELRKLLREE